MTVLGFPVAARSALQAQRASEFLRPALAVPHFLALEVAVVLPVWSVLAMRLLLHPVVAFQAWMQAALL